MKESDEDFTQLQTLLRLKRYETPPPGNVETFLYEFHRRQRAELVRRPLWRIALDRLENLLPTPVFATPRMAYAAAAVTALSLAGVGVLTHSPSAGGNGSATVAQTVLSNNAAASGSTTSLVTTVTSRRAPINLAPNSASVQFVDADGANDIDSRFSSIPSSHLEAATRRDDNALRPRYVLESQPVRYEPRSSTF